MSWVQCGHRRPERWLADDSKAQASNSRFSYLSLIFLFEEIKKDEKERRQRRTLKKDSTKSKKEVAPKANPSTLEKDHWIKEKQSRLPATMSGSNITRRRDSFRILNLSAKIKGIFRQPKRMIACGDMTEEQRSQLV